jgi:uncharacterized delta-60 repeat protein
MSPRRVLASIVPAMLLATALAPGPATARNGAALGAVRDLDHPAAIEVGLHMSDVETSTGGSFLVTGWEDGSFDSTLVRLAPDGSYDRSFGNLGGVDWKDSAEVQQVEEQADGSIVTLGSRFSDPGGRDLVLHGMLADGSRDPAFGTNGVAFVDGYEGDYACGLTLQDDGSILAAYRSFEPTSDDAIQHLLLTRLLPDGTPDPSFGDGGTIDGAGCSPLVQANGRIVVRDVPFPPTSDCTFLRFLPDGSPDPSFGTSGAASFPGSGCRIVLRAGGGFLVAAETGIPGEISVHGLTADGAPDPSFGTDGVVTVSVGSGDAAAYDVIELPNGGIVAGGYLREAGTGKDLLLVGITSAGVLDPSFGIDGILALDRYGADSVDRLLPDGDRLFLQYETHIRAADPCCTDQNAISEVLPHASDTFPPHVRWRVPQPIGAEPYDTDRLGRLRGIVDEPESGVRGPVTVAVSRTMTDGSCQWMRADGRFRAGACDAMTWLPAAGAFAFELTLPRPLKPSVRTDVRAYRAYASATDGAGNDTPIPDTLFLNPVRFEVGR